MTNSIQNIQSILYLIFLLVFACNISKAQSIPDSTVKKFSIKTLVDKIYWQDDTINPAIVKTEFYNKKGHIDSSFFRNTKTNSLSACAYYFYNKKGKFIKQKDIWYNYPNDTMIFITTKYDLKKQNEKCRFDNKGRLIEVLHDSTFYVIKDTLIYDTLNNIISYSKYRRDSTEERTTTEYNQKNQLYKSTLTIYINDILQYVSSITFNFYKPNGLLEKSNSYGFGTDIPTCINQFEYTFY